MQDRCDQFPAKGVEFGISIVVGSFHKNWKRGASHPGSDLVELIFAVRSQFRGLADKVHLVKDKVSSFRIRLHLVEVSTFHRANGKFVRDRERSWEQSP